MSAKLDPRIDAHIAAAPEAVRPILSRLRALVHAGCPNVEETIKWSRPFFMYRGILCGMSAFKAHCLFGFWHKDVEAAIKRDGWQPPGSFGRLETLKDLPSERAMLGYMRLAMKLNEAGVPALAPRRKATSTPRPLAVPAELTAALKKNPRAAETLAAFSNTKRKQYVEWIATAKGDETRARRLAASLARLNAGQPCNWQYLP